MNRFFLADHHFGQDSIYTFKDKRGHLIRPWADRAQKADELMIAAHNAVVGPRDTFYCMGDVVMKAHAFERLSRMNGRKILIRGNHDIFKMKKYAEHFEDIRAEHKMDNVLFTHRPMHPDCLPDWCLGNVHGHTHQRVMKTADGRVDVRYLNVCVEHVGLSPLPYEEVVQRLHDQRPEFSTANV